MGKRKLKREKKKKKMAAFRQGEFDLLVREICDSGRSFEDATQEAIDCLLEDQVDTSSLFLYKTE